MSRFRIFLFSILIFCLGCSNPEKEVHLIPFGHIGKVEIVYNQKDGVPVEYDDKRRRIYRIPDNGVLLTQFSPNSGGVSLDDIEFYYVDSTRKKKIDWFTGINPKFRNFEESVENYPDLVCAFGAHIESGGKTADGNRNILISYVKLEYRVDSLKNL